MHDVRNEIIFCLWDYSTDYIVKQNRIWGPIHTWFPIEKDAEKSCAALLLNMKACGIFHDVRVRKTTGDRMELLMLTPEERQIDPDDILPRTIDG